MRSGLRGWVGGGALAVSVLGGLSLLPAQAPPERAGAETERTLAAESARDIPLTVRQSLEAGNAAFEAGRYAEARGHYAQARSVLPDQVLLLVNSGLAAFYDNDPAEAEALLQRALDGDREVPAAWQALGLIYLDSQRFEEAMASFAQVIIREPRNSRARNYLGVAVGQLGWFDGAEAEFRRALEIDPRYADAHFNLAYFALQRRRPAVELARRHYREAVTLGAARDPELEKMLPPPTGDPETPREAPSSSTPRDDLSPPSEP